MKYTLRANKQTAQRLRSIAHFVKPGAHAYCGKYDRVRRVETTKQTHKPKRTPGVSACA